MGRRVHDDSVRHKGCRTMTKEEDVKHLKKQFSALQTEYKHLSDAHQKFQVWCQKEARSRSIFAERATKED